MCAMCSTQFVQEGPGWRQSRAVQVVTEFPGKSEGAGGAGGEGGEKKGEVFSIALQQYMQCTQVSRRADYNSILH